MQFPALMSSDVELWLNRARLLDPCLGQPFSSGKKAPYGNSPVRVQTINPVVMIPPLPPNCGI